MAGSSPAMTGLGSVLNELNSTTINSYRYKRQRKTDEFRQRRL